MNGWKEYICQFDGKTYNRTSQNQNQTIRGNKIPQAMSIQQMNTPKQSGMTINNDLYISNFL